MYPVFAGKTCMQKDCLVPVLSYETAPSSLAGEMGLSQVLAVDQDKRQEDTHIQQPALKAIDDGIADETGRGEHQEPAEIAGVDDVDMFPDHVFRKEHADAQKKDDAEDDHRQIVPHQYRQDGRPA